MRISLVAAIARGGVIGRDGTIPWRIPEDMVRFREVTMGHPVVMGRKTWESLPDRFRPLPGRRNLVITRSPDWHADGAEGAGSLAEALDELEGAEQVFVIGGAQIYAAALPLADELLLTEIDLDAPGDTLFPPYDRDAFAEVAREPHASGDGTAFAFVTYVRRRHSVSRVVVGTSGWGYPSWQPGFYPAGLDRGEFLSFYAGLLAAVELNATKYRLPSEEQFASWAAQVPDGFRFAVKAPNGVERRLATFEERVRHLGDRLGCVRVVVERPRDDGFLELLLGSTDPRIRYALDLRDPTWDGVEERLAEAEAVRVDDVSGRAGWAYLRYRELRYTDAELEEIAVELGALDRAGVETFAFFRHGDAPDAPMAAVQVARRHAAG